MIGGNRDTDPNSVGRLRKNQAAPFRDPKLTHNPVPVQRFRTFRAMDLWPQQYGGASHQIVSLINCWPRYRYATNTDSRTTGRLPSLHRPRDPGQFQHDLAVG